MKRLSTNKLFTAISLALLLGQFVLQLNLARVDSQTTDEAVHLSAGYTYLTKGDFRFNPEHPVLIKAISAIPLLLMDVKLPANYDELWNRSGDYFYDSWRENRQFGEELLYESGNDPSELLFWGRFPMVLLTLVLGLTIFITTKKYFSHPGALVATAMFTLNPIVNAHGHLIATDIGVSLGYLLAIITFMNFLKDRSSRNLVYFALAFSFAQLVKYTAVILFPVIAILFVYACYVGFVKKGQRVKVVLQVVIAMFAVWAIIWAGHGFKSERIPTVNSYSNATKSRNGAIVDYHVDPSISDKVIRRISPLIVPRDYFKGLYLVFAHVEDGHDSYLLGQYSRVGWWYYFPVIFVAKNPIPTILLFAIGLVFAFRAGSKRREYVFIALASFLFLAFAMYSKANLGVRHILPFIVVLTVVTGGALAPAKNIFLKAVIGLAVVFLAVEFILAYPYYLSYFNQFFGGRDNGYKTAGDSNLDWGRDLKDIARYIKEHNLSPLYVEYGWNGEGALKYYGIESRGGADESSRGYLIVGGTGVLSYPWLDTVNIYDKVTPSVFVYKLEGK